MLELGKRGLLLSNQLLAHFPFFIAVVDLLEEIDLLLQDICLLPHTVVRLRLITIQGLLSVHLLWESRCRFEMTSDFPV